MVRNNSIRVWPWFVQVIMYLQETYVVELGMGYILVLACHKQQAGKGHGHELPWCDVPIYGWEIECTGHDHCVSHGGPSVLAWYVIATSGA